MFASLSCGQAALVFMQVVLHRDWLVARWPPIWLTVPRICVRSALITNLHALWENQLSNCSV